MTVDLSANADPETPGLAAVGLTAEQCRAVSARETSVVLSSGAGCGKTHVLTQRYLSHLHAAEAEVGQLVAITFTDRAARQMRERIRRTLLDRLRAAPDAEASRWEAHLRGLETAPITTIHAFCGTLLRQFAVEAGLDPHFDVLDDALAANLEAEALTDCLQRLLPDPAPLGEDLRKLIFLFGWPATVEAVRSLMRRQDATLWQAWQARPADDIAAEWQESARRQLLPAYVEHLVTAVPKIAHCLTLLRKLDCLGPITRSNVARILEETPLLASADNLAAAVEVLTEAAKVEKERAKAWRSTEDYEAVKKAFKDFRDELPKRLCLFLEAADGLADAIVAGQRFLRVAAAAAQAYRLRKQRSGGVDFQDLLTRARDLLRDHADVREQLQRRYRFLLIDELQDTDRVQMELVESLAGAELTTGKLFAVGDAKQAIYRWRGAEVELFRDLSQKVPHEGRLKLTHNFRSQPALLDFTNALFARHIRQYTPLVAHHPQANPGPCVEFLWYRREGKERAHEYRGGEADAIARRIRRMVAGETLVRADGTLRAVRPGDIVLLFRAMSNVHIYEAALRKHGLDYYLVGGRAFYAQQEIYDLLNLLRALENPQDAVSLAGTLRSPFCCLSDEALFLLACHRDGLWAGLHDDATFGRLPDEQRPAAERARRFLDRWRTLKDRLPIAGLLGEVFADSGYDAAMQFEFLGDRKLANLWKLLDMARTFDRSGQFGLADFIQRLGDLVKSQPREEQAATQPENADVVRLMSIHQAKGLEFPVVIVPDLAARGGGGHPPVAVWDAQLGCVVKPPADEEPPFTDYGWRLWEAAEDLAEYHEDLRTLYVACTRAEDYLVLSASLPEPFKPTNAWMLTLAERFDLETGECRAEDGAAEERPKVCVTDPATLAAAVAHVPRQELPERAEVAAERITSVMPGLTSQDVVPLPALTTASGGRKSPVEASEVSETGGLRPPLAALMDQFASEDGSDRRTWLRPHERLSGRECSPQERTLRDVLESWDFRDRDGWRSLLREPDAELEAMLACFAASPTRRKLATAKDCRRNVEFLFAVAPGLPRVGDMIDCLWQDVKGSWHILAWTTGPLAEEAVRSGFRPVVQAEAVQQALGTRPRTVSVYSFEDGRALALAANKKVRDTALADLGILLKHAPAEAAWSFFPLPAGERGADSDTVSGCMYQ